MVVAVTFTFTECVSSISKRQKVEMNEWLKLIRSHTRDHIGTTILLEETRALHHVFDDIYIHKFDIIDWSSYALNFCRATMAAIHFSARIVEYSKTCPVRSINIAILY